MANVMENFQRQIGVQMRTRGDGSALLTGTIRDCFHDILLEVEITLATMAITAIRVDFRQAPTPTCKDVAPQLAGLVGMTIGPGMSRRLAAILSGSSGCGNLRNLLQSLLPLALNLSAAAGIDDETEMLDAIHHRLAGTCAGYMSLPSDTKIQGS
jgi:hypothetical protein